MLRGTGDRTIAQLSFRSCYKDTNGIKMFLKGSEKKTEFSLKLW
ncbi:hypothetical protein [Leptolyngbya sp. FACHB-671]|nr:hypothetical protein [Leptolyngbya sp. FACHB-671]